MQGLSHLHPVRRIRESFKTASEASGLKEFHTSAGFARLIGRAASSVRNVESGQTKKWDRIAKQIESVVGVSADWMLGSPDPSDPIIDVDGGRWEPEKNLDYLGGAGDNINWRSLLSISPKGAVKLASRIVELKLREDLVRKEKLRNNPSTSFLADLAKLFEKHQCLDNEVVSDEFVKSLISDCSQMVMDVVKVQKSSIKQSMRQ